MVGQIIFLGFLLLQNLLLQNLHCKMKIATFLSIFFLPILKSNWDPRGDGFHSFIVPWRVLWPHHPLLLLDYVVWWSCFFSGVTLPFCYPEPHHSCSTHRLFVPVSRLCVSQIRWIDQQTHLVPSVEGNNWLLIPRRPRCHMKSPNMQS